jgi:hypothetical protein
VLAAKTAAPGTPAPVPTPLTPVWPCTPCAIAPSPLRAIGTEHSHPGALAVAPTPHASRLTRLRPFHADAAGTVAADLPRALLSSPPAAHTDTLSARPSRRTLDTLVSASRHDLSTARGLCMPAELHDTSLVLRRSLSAARRRAAP